MEHFNSNIQLSKDVIEDIFKEIKPHTKMLVFGLGHDSKMWYEGNNKNTFFVENNEQYIKLGMKDISCKNIVIYNYKTTCRTSITLTDNEIKSFIIPKQLMDEAPFDIILIDGPEGHSMDTPGRVIPCYWTTMLSKPGAIVYIDDANRNLEAFCIQKFFKEFPKKVFNTRDKCVKIIF